MNHRIARRRFLYTSALGTAGLWLGGCLAPKTRRLSANEKLNLGIIGTANRARENLHGVAQENIVALCDIDDNYLAAAKKDFPLAKTYSDFRKLLEQTDLDAVVISTADHTHAAATAAALRLGKHVYCEKPLTHTVHEARTITHLAARRPWLATQMGTQIHAGDNYRRVVELIQTGAIGPVKECHVWHESRLPGGDRPQETPPVPPQLHWDLWLGPAPVRPYHPAYVPGTWRRWWDFGQGILGDFGCHYMDLPFWALRLGHPETVEAEGPPVHPETVSPWLIVKYQFPARATLPPVQLTWYDGGKRPALVESGQTPNWKSGVLFVGQEGMLIADYERRKLLPETRFAGFQPPPPSIAPSIGHHAEWLRACKTGSPTTCNFGYSGVLAESVLLGVAAYRSGQRIRWDAKQGRAIGAPGVDPYLHREYRQGWTL